MHLRLPNSHVVVEIIALVPGLIRIDSEHRLVECLESAFKQALRHQKRGSAVLNTYERSQIFKSFDVRDLIGPFILEFRPWKDA